MGNNKSTNGSSGDTGLSHHHGKPQKSINTTDSPLAHFFSRFNSRSSSGDSEEVHLDQRLFEVNVFVFKLKFEVDFTHIRAIYRNVITETY